MDRTPPRAQRNQQAPGAPARRVNAPAVAAGLQYRMAAMNVAPQARGVAAALEAAAAPGAMNPEVDRLRQELAAARLALEAARAAAPAAAAPVARANADPAMVGMNLNENPQNPNEGNPGRGGRRKTRGRKAKKGSKSRKVRKGGKKGKGGKSRRH